MLTRIGPQTSITGAPFLGSFSNLSVLPSLGKVAFKPRSLSVPAKPNTLLPVMLKKMTLYLCSVLDELHVPHTLTTII
jgi:hypothetical protein